MEDEDGEETDKEFKDKKEKLQPLLDNTASEAITGRHLRCTRLTTLHLTKQEVPNDLTWPL